MEPAVDGGDCKRPKDEGSAERERAAPTPRAEPDQNSARQDAELVIKKGESDRDERQRGKPGTRHSANNDPTACLFGHSPQRITDRLPGSHGRINLRRTRLHAKGRRLTLPIRFLAFADFGLTPSPVTVRWQSERRREAKNAHVRSLTASALTLTIDIEAVFYF